MESDTRQPLWRSVYGGSARPTSKGRQRNAWSRPTSTSGGVPPAASPPPPVPRLAFLSNSGVGTAPLPEAAIAAARPVSRSRIHAGQVLNAPSSSKALESPHSDSAGSRPATRQSPYLTPPTPPQPLPLSARASRTKATADGSQQQPAASQATAAPAGAQRSEAAYAATGRAAGTPQHHVAILPNTAVRPSTGTGRMRSAARTMAATQQLEVPPHQQLSPYLVARRAAKPWSPGIAQSRPGTAAVSQRPPNAGQQQQQQQQQSQQAGIVPHHSSRYGSAEQPLAAQVQSISALDAAPATQTHVASATASAASMQDSACPPAVEADEDIPVALSTPTEHPLPDGTFGVTLDSYMGRMVTTPADRNATSGLGQSDEDVALAHLAQQQQRHASRPASHKAAALQTTPAVPSPFQQKAASLALSDSSSDSDDEILDLSMMDVDAVSGQVSRQPSEPPVRLSGQGAAWTQPAMRKPSAGSQVFASARANSLDLRPATAAAAPGVRPGLLDSPSPVHSKQQQHQKQQLALLDTNRSQDFIKETSLGHLSASLFTPNGEEAGRLSVSGSQRELWGSYDASSHDSFSAASRNANSFSRGGGNGAFAATNCSSSPTRQHGEQHGAAAVLVGNGSAEAAVSAQRQSAHSQQLHSSTSHAPGTSSFMSRVAAAAAAPSADLPSLYHMSSMPGAAQGSLSPKKTALQLGGRSTIMGTSGNGIIQHEQQQLQPPQPHVWHASGSNSSSGLSTMPATTHMLGSAGVSNTTPLFTRRGGAGVASVVGPEARPVDTPHTASSTGIRRPHSASSGAATRQVPLDPSSCWGAAAPDVQEPRPPSRQKSAAPLHLFGDDLRDSLAEPGRSPTAAGGRPQSAIGLSRNKPQQPLRATLQTSTRDIATAKLTVATSAARRAGHGSATAWGAHAPASRDEQLWTAAPPPASAAPVAAPGRPRSRGRQQHAKAQDELFPDAPTTRMPASCWAMEGTCPPAGNAALHLGMGRQEFPSDDSDSDGYDF